MAYKDLVQQLYVGFYGRPADKEGLGFWNTKLEEADGDFNVIKADFAASSEYQVPMDGDDVDYEALVNMIYNNLFGRDAEDEGKEFYVSGLESGDFSTDDIVKRIIDGAEDIDAKDKTVMENRAAFSNYVTEAAEDFDFDANDAELLVLLFSIDEDADLDAVKVIFDDWVQQFEPPAPPPADEGKTFWLSEYRDMGWAPGDDFYGTVKDDTYYGDVLQNMLGQQVNSLGTGDRLDGNAGDNLLMAQVTEGAYVGGGNMPIQAFTKNIQDIKLEAMNAHISSEEGNSEVYVNAKNMHGIEEIWSWHSNANLVIKDLTTLANDGTTKRPLDDISIGMGYTGNADSSWYESNLEVYFDQNYLRPTVDPGIKSVVYRIMNQDGFDETGGERPLDGIYVQRMEFEFNGVRYELSGYINEDFEGDGSEFTTYEELVQELQDNALPALVAANSDVPALQDLSIRLGGIFREDDLGRPGRDIVLEAPAVHDLTVNEFWAEVRPAENSNIRNSNRFERADEELPIETQEMRISIDLEKVGRGSDGGELVVGGMDKDGYNQLGGGAGSKGIPIFDVTVHGDSEKPSSLSGLRSTNNTLEEVYITTAPAYVDDAADLKIGNSNTPNVPDGIALKDVRIVDASGFYGNLSVTAELTDESLPKYLDLVDDAANPAVDNRVFSYTGGAGDDMIYLMVDGTVAAHEDFALSMTGGHGNDKLVLEFDFDPQSNEYFNQSMWQQSLLQAAKTPMTDLQPNNRAEQVHIEDMYGDNTIWTPGWGDVKITTGSGNDTIYTDNSGLMPAWAFNSANANLNNLQGTQLAPALLFNSTLTVTYTGATVGGGITSPDAQQYVNGFEAIATIPTTIGGNYYGDQRHINQAMKDAINNHEVLGKLLVAYDGPNNTLVVESLIDGSFASDDIQVTIEAPTWGSLSSGERSNLLSAVRDFENNSNITNADIWGSETPVAGAVLRYDISGLATRSVNPIDGDTYYQGLDDGTNWAVLGANGTPSGAQSNNLINAGPGQDVIVLGTGQFSNEVVKFTGPNIGHNTIVNFENDVDSTGLDVFDFTYYLTNASSLTGSSVSAIRIDTSYVAQGGNVGPNTTSILTFTPTVTQTWEALTPSALVTALNGGTSYGAAGNALVNNSLSANNLTANNPNLVGNTLHHIVFVENPANAGEYKVFQLQSTLVTSNAGSFSTDASWLGYIDVGRSLNRINPEDTQPGDVIVDPPGPGDPDPEQTVITLFDLLAAGADDDTTPFDAGAGMFRFDLDAAEAELVHIENFSDDDTLWFTNSPTGLPGDFNVTQDAFGDDEALVSVGSLEVQLLGLVNGDGFNNAATFQALYGEDALVFA